MSNIPGTFNLHLLPPLIPLSIILSRMPKRSRSRKSRKNRKSRKSKINRSLGRLGRAKDVHHFRQTISGGQLVIPSGATTLYQSCVWILRLPNIPIYATMSQNFEFVRLNKCSITYNPKSNMQTNLPFLPSSGVNTQGTSISGTLITGIDQVPLLGNTATANPATCWLTDATESNVTLAVPYTFTSNAAQPGVDYIRGLQGSKETELYKKVKKSFYPTFYSEIIDSNSGNATGSNTGLCFERRIKKWINCTALSNSTGSGTAYPNTPNAGPFYYGPVFALCVNQPAYMGASETFPLYDIRLTYSVSFKRIRGQ